MFKLLSTTAVVALLAATSAFANSDGPKPAGTTVIAAQQQGQLQGQFQDQNQNQDLTNANTNNNGSPSASANTKDETHVFASPSFGLALPSGSNGEMAPEGWSAAVSSPFGGIGFGDSVQTVSPSAGMTLMSLAQAAWGEKAEDVNSQRDGVTATAFLCTYFKEFATKARIVCD